MGAEGGAGREMLEQSGRNLRTTTTQRVGGGTAECTPETEKRRREKEFAIREAIEDIQNQYRTMYEEVVVTRCNPNWAEKGEQLAMMRAKLPESGMMGHDFV